MIVTDIEIPAGATKILRGEGVAITGLLVAHNKTATSSVNLALYQSNDGTTYDTVDNVATPAGGLKEQWLPVSDLYTKWLKIIAPSTADFHVVLTTVEPLEKIAD